MNRYLMALEEFRPLGLNTRTINILVSQQIFTVAHLGQLTEQEVAKIPGIGSTTLRQLRKYVRQDGRRI
jgi:DNA-directed RNA polymerase alpha subunit